MYSLNATVPIFLVILAGYVLKNKFHMFSDQTISQLNKFNFNVTLPTLLFLDVGLADFLSVWDTRYVLFCIIASVICISAVAILTHFFMKDQSLVGEFIQACYRGSAAVLGIAFIQNIYGATTRGPLMIIATVPVYNIAAVLILSFTAPRDKSVNKAQALKKSLMGIVTNPIILGIAAGVLFSLSGLELPAIVSKTLRSFSNMATPLCLVALGAGFEGKKALKMIKPTLLCAFIKLFAQAAIFLPIAFRMGFRDEMLVALLVMLGAPTTASCYIMARNMGHDGVLTSSTVVATSVLGAVSLTFWLFLMRSLGYI